MFKKDKPDLGKWEILEERTIYECNPWIRLDIHKIKLPSGKIVDDFHRLVMPENVVVYPVTAIHEILMLRAYRHGVGNVTYLFPGGFIEKGEIPLDAAKRELLEETGFRGGDWQSMGSFVPHSNYGCGKVHMFRATDVEKVQSPDSGDLEEAEIHLMNREMLMKAVSDGRITSLSSIAALSLSTNDLFV